MLTVGKRLPKAVYLHTSMLVELDEAYNNLVEGAAARAGVDRSDFNVVKFALNGERISLLQYGAFLAVGFPELEQSWSVDLARDSVNSRDYRQEGNPPILHRKETLLSEDHPLQREFCALTTAAEQAGLFENARDIGRKLAWETRLNRVGLQVSGNRLLDISAADSADSDDAEEIHRHRTALVRYSLSSPMQMLWRHGYLDGDHSVFDYGCGRGDDVRALLGRGIDASGWDPHFATEESRNEADVVNLGFVLNVIEDADQRRAALEGAWSLTEKLLVIAVMTGGKSTYEGFRLYRDGVVTSRGTFQKYFRPAEFREYVGATLEREPIALAPGIIFVFKDDQEEQRFLAARQTRRGPSSSLPSVPHIERAPRVRAPRVRAPRVRAKQASRSRWIVHRELLEAFADRCLALGRAPEPDEFSQSAEVRAKLGTTKKVLKRVQAEWAEKLAAVREQRERDRMVYLALNLFEQRRSVGSLPDAVRRDVRAFWGAFANANTSATALLYSAGDVAIVLAACQQAAEKRIGHLEDRALYVHSSVTQALPSVLRVYLGCAARVYGDFDAADLVKIHIGSNKVSLMTYDDFEGRAIPLLTDRIKITLGRADFQAFHYGTEYEPQPLYLKSRYLPPEFPGRDRQLAFDQALDELALFDFSGYGPDNQTFNAGLQEAGWRVQRSRLVKLRAARRKASAPASLKTC